jgi:acyl carrier protein
MTASAALNGPGTDAIERIGRIFREALAIEPPPPDVDLIATGLLDSMAIVTLIVELEEQFGIVVPPEQLELDSLRTIERLASLVDTSRGQQRPTLDAERP